MKTVAIISDIHANLPALEGVLEDIDRRKNVEAIYHLGDLVGYAPWPNEVVALLRKRGIAGVAGNYDSTVAARYEHCGCSYDDPKDIELAHLSYSWTLQAVSEEVRAHLGALPFRLDFRPWGGHLAGPKITMLHGTPVLNTAYWTEDRPESFCVQMANKVGARSGDTIVFGHTHKPWRREIGGIHFVNAGSAGRPKDGDWRACYLLLHLDGGPRENPSTRAEFIRVAYDLKGAQNGIWASALPDAFAEVLQTAGGKG